MSDEIKEEFKNDKREHKCTKELKMFLLMILGSFLGCLVALCLFTAAVKPQPHHGCPCHQPRIEAGRFHHDIGAPRGEFRRGKFQEHRGERPNQKPPVKPEQKV